MKTAEQIIDKAIENQNGNLDYFYKNEIIDLMEEYAQQKVEPLVEAARHLLKLYEWCDTDPSWASLKQAILNYKP